MQTSPTATAQNKNGFDLSEALIPAKAIKKGGPPRDGIPAIDEPEFMAPSQADWLKQQDRVLGVEVNGKAKAYPIRILNWHEIVNDEVGGDPVVVTYCPLCGSGIAFLAARGGRTLDFGVSGLLYNSDVLLYDRQTETLWSQLMAGKAVAGPLKGKSLPMLPTANTTWGQWYEEHPSTKVLSRETGYNRDYSQDPYAGYEDKQKTMFPTTEPERGKDLHPKTQVVGLKLKGQAKAYPFPELEQAGGPVEDQFAGHRITVTYNAQHTTARVLLDGQPAPQAVQTYWFAWGAFHPQTAIYRAE